MHARYPTIAGKNHREMKEKEKDQTWLNSCYTVILLSYHSGEMSQGLPSSLKRVKCSESWGKTKEGLQ